MDTNNSFIEIDSKKIYIEEYGKDNKRSLIYFHGGPGASCLDFKTQAKALGKKYHVISFDQYGVMRSDAISENEKFGMIEHVQMIDKMREKLGVKSWSVLGHSYGGMLACLYAYSYPNNIESIIYDCPTWNFVLSSKSIAFFIMQYFHNIGSKEGIDNCNRIIEKDYINRAEVLDDLMLILNLVEDQKTRNYLHSVNYEEYNEHRLQENLPDDGWEKGNLHAQKLIETGEIFNDYLPYLKNIKQPSLLLVGKHDPTCSIEQRDYFNKFSCRGKIVEFKNSGHFPRIEEPHAYTKAIIEFLDSVK